MKVVTIGLKCSEDFVRRLHANVQMSGLPDRDFLDPIHQLALIAVMEMRGAVPEQSWAALLPEYRTDAEPLQVVTELRKVEFLEPVTPEEKPQ